MPGCTSTSEYCDLTGEDLLALVQERGGHASRVERDPETGVITSLQASGPLHFSAHAGLVLESLQAAALAPKKPLGDLAQTSISTASGQVQVIGLSEWTIDWKRKTVDTTTTDDSEYEGAQGSTKSWTAKAKYMFIDSEVSQADNILAAIDSLQLDIQTWNFFPTVETGRAAFQGDAIIDGITLTSGMGKVVGMDVSLKGTGPLKRLAQAAPVNNPNTVTGLSAQVPEASNLIFADTSTGTLYRLAAVSGALTVEPYSGPLDSTDLYLADTVTGTVYDVTVDNGALTWTPASGPAVSSIAIVDDVTSATEILSIANGAMTLS